MNNFVIANNPPTPKNNGNNLIIAFIVSAFDTSAALSKLPDIIGAITVVIIIVNTTKLIPTDINLDVFIFNENPH